MVTGFAGLHADLLAKISGMLSGTYMPGLVVVSGATGCGKTALLKHVVQLLQDDFGAATAVPVPVENGNVEVCADAASAVYRAVPLMCCSAPLT